MKCISIFKCNPQIEVIDKSHCSLEDVPNFQNYSRSLEELFLDANKLTSLNDNVFRLTKLRRFSFSDNAVQDIPPDIAKLVNLVELDCSRNKIQIIPEQIKFLRGLQVCDFSANNIETLPTGLVQLKNLTCLTLNYCPIKSLPDDFGLLKNLESLELRENELESLPPSLAGLESLKKLDLGRNLINKLPDDIGRLTNLEYLLVDGNRLDSIPASVGKLKNLQCLDLSQQEYGLKFLPEEIGGLVSLTDLHLSDNHVQTLPNGIKDLRCLTIFKADSNFLSELNPNIGSCTSMQELVLTSNQIKKLPSSIGSLVDMHSLNIDDNHLKELPTQIGNLRKLGILSLRDNRLTHLPVEIGQLEMLRVMDVSGNCLEYLPASITVLNLKALWLSKNQAQPLPKLQVDELPGSSLRILTCYLLPQQGDNVEDVSELPDANQNANHEAYTTALRQAAVSFDTAALEDIDITGDANFVRHDTPHPRELKARHMKLFNNQPVGKPGELSGVDNASFSLVDNNHQQGYEQEYEQESSNAMQPRNQQNYFDTEHNIGIPKGVSPPTLTSHTDSKPKLANFSTVRETTTTSAYYGDSEDMIDYNIKSNNNIEPNGLDVAAKYRQILRESGNDFEQTNDNHLNNKPQQDQRTGLPETGCHVMYIVVRRDKSHKPGLGLSIAGGKDTPPYKDNDEGIFVSKITRGGPAEAAGVKVGDKVLAVNNVVFYEGISHQKAVDIFKRIKPDAEFKMRVLRYPNDELPDQEHIEDDYNNSRQPETNNATNDRASNNNNIGSSTFTRTYTIPVPAETNGGGNTVNNLRQFFSKEPERVKSNAATLPAGSSLLEGPVSKNIIFTTLVKSYNYDLGLILAHKSDATDAKSSWSNVVIVDIKPNSIAARDGKLQVDDRLLSINGTDVTGIDLDRIQSILEGTERFIRIVVSRGDLDDPLSAALRNMPTRPPLGSWFSSTSNMYNRPSLIESYQRPTFGSVSSLQKQNQVTSGAKPPKPPKPTHLLPKDSETPSPTSFDDGDPIAKPRARGAGATGSEQATSQISDAEKRAVWRRERLKSIEDDVEMAKLIAEAQRRRREEA